MDQVVAVPDPEAYETARRAAVLEGLRVGPSSGAALAAVSRLLEEGAGGRIAVVLPDTGDRYTSLLPEVVGQR